MVGVATLLRLFPAILFAGALFLFVVHYITTQNFRRDSLGSYHLAWLPGSPQGTPFQALSPSLGPSRSFIAPR
jgi:hypothetical protein